MALSASTVLLGTMLVPSARASVAPGHNPVRVEHRVSYNRQAAIRVVNLGARFSPPSVALAPGEPLIVIVNHSVRARLEMTAGQSLLYGGQEGDVYLFYGKKVGMATVAARVQPRCVTKVCAQWRTAPNLMVTTY